MKKNLLLTTTFGAALVAGTLAHAAPARIDLHRVIEDALAPSERSLMPAEQAVDIAKINQLLATAKDKVIVEFGDFVESANASVNPNTYNLDTLTLDLSADATIKKSIWAQQPTTVAMALGTKLVDENGGKSLAAELGLSLRTQSLVLVKYLANLVLEENPIGQAGDTESDKMARAYFTDLINAADLNVAYARTLVLREEVLASTSEELAEARNMLADLSFAANHGEFSVALKEMEFYGIRLSAKFAVNDTSASAKVFAVDVANSLKEQIEEHKADITMYLLEIQNASEETRASIEDGFRGIFTGAKQLVGIE